MRAAHPALVGELEDALGARVERPVNRVAEAGQALAGAVDLPRQPIGHRAGLVAGRNLRLGPLEQPGARLGGAQDHRPGAEDPRGDGAVQRSGVGGEGHPRGDVGGHHPVLGDRDQEQIEEEALLRARLPPGEQQMEVLGEREPSHQVAREVPSAHLDPVGIGLAYVSDGAPGPRRHSGDAMDRADGCQEAYGEGVEGRAIDPDAFNAFEAASWDAQAAGIRRLPRPDHRAPGRAAARRRRRRPGHAGARPRHRTGLRGRPRRRAGRLGGRDRHRSRDARSRGPPSSRARAPPGRRARASLRRRVVRRRGRQLPHPPPRASRAGGRRVRPRPAAGRQARVDGVGPRRARAAVRAVPPGGRRGRRGACPPICPRDPTSSASPTTRSSTR